RGIAPQGTRHDSNQNVGPYDDTFVVLQHDAAGHAEVTELLGSTHAGQKTGPNPHGVAQIEPGNYQAVPNGPYHNMASWHVETLQGADEIPCWRDQNKNGYIDPTEKAHPTTATRILFHNGVKQDHGTSIGCQTMRPDIQQHFIQQVGADTTFQYTLVDANLPEAGAPGLPPTEPESTPRS
ncbi:MAG: hypothetical protein ACYCW6_13845, partial [Candidatus Xenobia bacterium]